MLRSVGTICILFSAIYACTHWLAHVPGLETEFAEPLVPESSLRYPVTALANIAYVMVCLYWLWWLKQPAGHRPKGEFLEFFELKAVLCGMYAPVQFMRTVTQAPRWAAMDQCVTLTMFALPAYALLCALGYLRMSFRGCVVALALSAFSYLTALFHPLGYKPVLLLHMLVTVSLCILAAARRPKNEIVLRLAVAFLCFAGFVAFSLLDKELVPLHEKLGLHRLRLSGQFWSRLCDAMQIHHFLAFFNALLLARKNKADKLSE